MYNLKYKNVVFQIVYFGLHNKKNCIIQNTSILEIVPSKIYFLYFKIKIYIFQIIYSEI